MLRKLLKLHTAAQASKRCLTTSKPRLSGGEWWYRENTPTDHNSTMYLTEALGAIMWWWITYNVWKEPGHVIGEWEFPKRESWTDEELGVPAIQKE